MENMETKCDTMFDIVQNLAKEVLEFKQTNYEENHIISMPHQMEQVAYDTLDDVVNNNANVGHCCSDEEGSDDESSDDEGSVDEGSVDEGSDGEGSDDEENVVTNNLPNDKITIPDYDKLTDIRVIEFDDHPVSSRVLLSDEYLADESLVVSEFVDEDDLKPVELNTEEFLNVNKINDADADADDDIGNHLSKSALKKLKLAELKRIATVKQITVDDAMTKNSIIEILLAN